MKKTIITIWLISLIWLVSCAQKNVNTSIPSIENKNLREINEVQNNISTIVWKIIKINDWIDWSEIVIETIEGTKYTSILSIPNLWPDSNFDFSDIKIWNTLELKGTTFQLWNENRLTADYAKLVISDNVSTIMWEVISTHEATEWIDSFLVKLKLPNDEEKEVIFNSKSEMRKIKSSQKIAINIKKESWLYIAQDILSYNNEEFEFTWTMKSVENWTDWYTVKLIDIDENVFFATISFANLWNNHEKYINFEEWKEVTVVWELWSMWNQKQITVRDIK